MLPATTSRVADQTPDEVNDRIRRQTEENIARYANAAPGAIRQRLAELDREWDIERAIEVNASAVILGGLALAVTRARGWVILSMIASGFLMQHALQGWCPPVSLFRRMGMRTSGEIEHERYALKALRGDFQNLHPPSEDMSGVVRQALEAVRM